MSRTVAATVGLVLAASVLAGCGSSGNVAEGRVNGDLLSLENASHTRVGFTPDVNEVTADTQKLVKDLRSPGLSRQFLATKVDLALGFVSGLCAACEDSLCGIRPSGPRPPLTQQICGAS